MVRLLFIEKINVDSELNRIALLIDADNISYSSIELMLSELATHGAVSIRRAYGNWKNPSLKGWEENIHEYAIQPIQQYDLVKGKNATDMALVIDAMDILYTKNVSAICIASSDSDYTPLVTRIIADGKVVIGFGEKKTPKPFVNACSKFLYVDAPKHDSGNTGSRSGSISKKLKVDAKLINMLRNAIEASQTDSEWVPLSKIGSHISNHASFDPRNYGFNRLSDLVKEIDLFEIKQSKGQHYIVRDVRKNRAT